MLSLIYQCVKAANVVVPTVPFILVGGTVLRSIRWRRRAVIRAAKEELHALNSQANFHIPLDTPPVCNSFALRGGFLPTKTNSSLEYKRGSHTGFCARWARAAKARFEFARVCEDSPINRAALHRWYLDQWKKQDWFCFKKHAHRLDLFMTDAIDMAFLPTAEMVASESKKAIRKRARMEYYNERKFVSGWK